MNDNAYIPVLRWVPLHEYVRDEDGVQVATWSGWESLSDQHGQVFTGEWGMHPDKSRRSGSGIMRKAEPPGYPPPRLGKDAADGAENAPGSLRSAKP